MNELEQFVSILKEIASTIEKVNPAISGLTNSLASMVEKFSTSERGMKTFIEIINVYIETINRLSSGKSPVINIPQDTIDRLTTVSNAISQIQREVEKIKEPKINADVIAKEVEKAKQEVSKLNQEEIIITPEIAISNVDIYAEKLEKAFSGIMKKLKDEFNIVSIVEEPKQIGKGIYRVIGEQIKEEGEEAKRVSFYIDRLGEVHSNLAFASRLTSEQVSELTKQYKGLAEVLRELGMTEKNILNVSARPDISPDALQVTLGDERRNFKKSVYIDKEGRIGFTKREFLKGFTEEQFNTLLGQFPELQKFVEQHNLSVKNLENAYHNASAGVRQFTFVTKNAEGVVEKLTLKLDEQGRVIRSRKEELALQSKALFDEMTKEFPKLRYDINSRFGNNFNVTRLQSGVYKVTGYEKEGEEIKKVVLYVDRLGKVHENLNNISKVTRDEIGKLAVDFQHLREEVFKYGYSLEDVINIERLQGGNVAKVTLHNEEIGKLTLYADKMGRIGRSLSEMRRQLPTEVLDRLADRFKNLTKEIEKYGASLKDISGIRQFGNITEISFTAKDENNMPYTKKLYGDAQGRIFEDSRQASQLTVEETLRISSAYKNAMDAANRFGGSVKNLVGVIRDEKTKITELVFAIKDANGEIKQFSVFTDEAGRVGFSKKDLGGRGFSTEELERVKRIYSSVIEKAEKYGFKIENLKKIHTEASTGITRFTFAMEGLNGETRMLSLSMDKYGNVLRDVQRKYQGFLDGVMRNIVEASKWAIAIQLTYVPLQKLNELINISIDNQSKLANVAIALNTNMRESGRVFKQIADVADETATSINDAIEGFSAAYRATAGLGNQFQRTAVALKVLKTSLILSKLASIDQAEAIDILVGALRQANMPLSQAEKLLDKWIAVSKNAQVGINDLAEAYSVVGAAALNSGFSVDKLNGIVAALVESTPYSGKEVGNILRSFISNVQSSEAERQLNEIGIAVRDLKGEFRDFGDILDEIASRYSAGIIDDTKLKELARSLAGGSRRAAPFINMIKVYGKALGIAKISNDAFGESEKALKVKLDTARSSLTRLANSFQKFAETIGSDGGVLDLFSNLSTVLSDIIKLMDVFVDTTGRAGVTLMTLLPLIGYLRRSNRLGAIAAPINTLSGKLFGYSGKEFTSQGWVKQPRFKLTPNMVATGLVGTAIIGGAASKYFSGNENDKQEAIGSIAGMTIGGILATAFGQPELAPLLMSAGDTIASGFVRSVNKDSGTIAQMMAEEFNKKKEEQKPNVTEESKTLEEKFYSSFFTRALGWASKASVDTVIKLLAVLGNKTAQKDVDIFDRGKGYRWGFAKFVAETGAFFGKDKQQLAIELLKASRIEADNVIPRNRLENPVTPFDKNVVAAAKSHQGEFSSIISRLEKGVKDAFQRGNISAAEYEKRLERISNLSSNLPFIYYSLGDSLELVGYKTKDSAEGLEKLSEIYVKGTDEEISKMTSLLTELEKVQQKIDDMSSKGVIIPVELRLKEKDLEQQVIDYANNTLQNIHVRNFNMPEVIKEKNATESDANAIYERAKEKMQEFGNKLIEAGVLTADEWQAYLKSLREMLVDFKEGILLTKGITRDAWETARKELLQENKLSPEMKKSSQQMRIQTVNFPSTRSAELHAALDWARNFIKTNFPDYKLKPQEVGLIYSDNGTEILHEDNLILQMAINKLVEINQKQLDGIYNIPSNATFWVPYQAFAMQFNAQGGGGFNGKSTSTTEEENKPGEEQQPTVTDNYQGLLDQDRRDYQAYNELYNQTKLQDEIGQLKYLKSLPIEPQQERRDFYHSEPWKQEPEKDIGFITKAFLPPLMLGLIGNDNKQSSLPSILDKFVNNMERAFSILGGSLSKEREKSKFEKLPDVKELGRISSLGNEQQPINFNLELTNRSTITLDGQVIAQVVSKYLGNQLLASVRGGSFNKSVEVV